MTHIEWQFGGWLANWPTWLAVGVLIALAVAGTIYVVWFYRRTLEELPPRARNLLTALRAMVVLLLLICLANPVRVENESPPNASQRTLAVLVDRSPSMSAPDHRGQTRLASAVRLWKAHETDAAGSFAKMSFHRFASELKPTGSFDDAVRANAPGGETHLFAALQQTLETGPAAILCLTDGLDTTSDNAGRLAAEAAHRGVPIYFAPGENRLLPMTSLALREIKAPARVLRRSQFTATALVELVAAREQELPVELWSGERRLSATRWLVRVGRNVISCPVKVDAGEAGVMPLEFRAGESPPQIAACTTEVVENTTMEVLYYQGALQWGYRFLRGALESDPSFRLTAILNPALHVQLTTGSPGDSAMTDLPEEARELQRFNLVLLAHVFADQFTPRQQQALVEYVRGGGSVLFISPDTSATERFSGTALEAMLPVAFAPRDQKEDALQRFRAQMAFNAPGGGRGNRAALQLAKNTTRYMGDTILRNARISEPVVLKSFALPANPRPSATSALFAGADPDRLPKFEQNAKVRAVKPGAEVLAVSRPASGAPEVLLARQQFGSGFVAALTTDLLWRWKLSLPSDSHAVEKFWQQLLLSLAPASGQGLRLAILTTTPAVRSPVALRISASTGGVVPKVESVSPTGERVRLTAQETKDAEGPAWDVSFTPTVAGNWEVRTTDSTGRTARVVFPVAEKAGGVDLSNLPPDLAGMRQLAESTGGALLEKTALFRPPVESAEKPRVKWIEPIWHNGWLLALLLGIYSAELIARRRLRLI
jgi:hypothetical protein